MLLQSYPGEVNPQVGHNILGAGEGAHIMQLAQLQLSQIVSNAVIQALTQHVEQVQTPIKFDALVFEGDSAASWLTWSQSVVHQARACGFDAELTAAEGEGLSIGAEVCYRSNVEPTKLRNAHAA